MLNPFGNQAHLGRSVIGNSQNSEKGGYAGETYASGTYTNLLLIYDALLIIRHDQ